MSLVQYRKSQSDGDRVSRYTRGVAKVAKRQFFVPPWVQIVWTLSRLSVRNAYRGCDKRSHFEQVRLLFIRPSHRHDIETEV